MTGLVQMININDKIGLLQVILIRFADNAGDSIAHYLLISRCAEIRNKVSYNRVWVITT